MVTMRMTVWAPTLIRSKKSWNNRTKTIGSALLNETATHTEWNVIRVSHSIYWHSWMYYKQKCGFEKKTSTVNWHKEFYSRLFLFCTLKNGDFQDGWLETRLNKVWSVPVLYEVSLVLSFWTKWKILTCFNRSNKHSLGRRDPLDFR